MGHATLLAQLAAQRHWTPRAAAKTFTRTAEELGLSASVSERSWQRWCAGRLDRAPQPANCQVLEHMFGHPVHELLAPPLIAVPARLSTNSSKDIAYWTCGTGGGSAPPKIDEEIAVVADESARFARSIRRIDEHALDQFDADVARLAADYLQRPVYLTFRRIAHLRAEVFSILDNAHHPLDQQRRLYEIAGRLCALLAHANADLGHPHQLVVGQAPARERVLALARLHVDLQLGAAAPAAAHARDGPVSPSDHARTLSSARCAPPAAPRPESPTRT